MQFNRYNRFWLDSIKTKFQNRSSYIHSKKMSLRKHCRQTRCLALHGLFFSIAFLLVAVIDNVFSSVLSGIRKKNGPSSKGLSCFLFFCLFLVLILLGRIEAFRQADKSKCKRFDRRSSTPFWRLAATSRSPICILRLARRTKIHLYYTKHAQRFALQNHVYELLVFGQKKQNTVWTNGFGRGLAGTIYRMPRESKNCNRSLWYVVVRKKKTSPVFDAFLFYCFRVEIHSIRTL